MTLILKQQSGVIMNEFEFLTEEQYKKMLDNGKPENSDQNHAPIVKLFLPFTKCVWLLSEITHEDEGIAFGLCDLGLGYPESGSVSLYELKYLDDYPFPVMSDVSFHGNYPMSVYCDAARVDEQISTDEALLQKYHRMYLSRITKKPCGPKPT